jgi:hypothetical protein
MDPVGFTIQNVDDSSIEAFFAVKDFESVNGALEAAYAAINKEDGGFEESYLRAIYPTTPYDLTKGPLSKTLRRAKIWKISPLSLVQKRSEMLEKARSTMSFDKPTYARKYQCKVCHTNGKRGVDMDYNHTFYGDFNHGGCKHPMTLFTLDEDEKSVFWGEDEDEKDDDQEQE